MGYQIEPDCIVGMGGEDRDVFARIARALGDCDALRWLDGLEPDKEWPGDFKCRFGDLADHLTGFVAEGNVASLIRSGDVSERDASILSAILSHCLQSHVKLSEIMDGSVVRLIEEVRTYGRFQ